MNDTAVVATCSCCRARFIGVPGGLCPECEKDSEFYRLSRKKGDPRQSIPYPALFRQWKARRAECREWRKTAEQAASDRAARIQAEQERAQALAVLNAAGIDPNPALALAADMDKLRAEMKQLELRLECYRSINERLEGRLAGKPEPWEAAMEALRAAQSQAAFPPDMWRRLVQLAHPDKHGGSPAATEATRWLMENRP